ncbi:MAG: hypothetical protein CVU11_15965 [Bacteroidetes bacterium HGW-Bacteroidetes-6]|jgi:hypothetical protein|nr:MAG: hypothetical protein CVU11_15965 [Bacteroidetes bacterium HGW-Bacteroidetes-6]
MDTRSREKEKAESLAISLLSGLLFAILFVVVFRNQMLKSDDFWVLKYCGSSNSFSKNFDFWWHNTNGRFASAFIQLLFFRLPVQFILIASAISTLLVTGFASFSLISAASAQKLIQHNRLIPTTVFLTIAIYLSSPAPVDVFLWPSAVFVHGWSAAALLLIASVLIRSNWKILHWIIAIVSTIFIGGSSETAEVILVLLIMLAFLKNSKLLLKMSILSAILLFATALHYYAPASLNRSQILIDSAPGSYLNAIFASAKQNIPVAVVSSAIAFIALLPIAKFIKFKTTKKTNILIGRSILAAVIVYTLAVAWIMKDSEPLRAAQPVFLLLLVPTIVAISQINSTKWSIVKLSIPILVLLTALIVLFSYPEVISTVQFPQLPPTP